MQKHIHNKNLSSAYRFVRATAFNNVNTVKDRLARNWPEIIVYILLLAIAAGMRLWDLGARAMHHDESLHAYYSFNLASGLGYDHNPMMHGPFQFEATAAVFNIFGDSDHTARLLYALAGTLIVALPILLRYRIGKPAAVITAALLTFSPTMLYFSRFARNDIIVAVWTLGLVIFLWRFLDTGKSRYLYITAVFLGLAFATKENVYLIVATLGMYIVAYVASNVYRHTMPRLISNRVPTPIAIWQLTSRIKCTLSGNCISSFDTRPGQFFMLLITVTLPLWGAFVCLLQQTPILGWSGLILASPVGGDSPVGSPVAGSIAVAVYVIVSLFVLAAYIGYKWNWSLWWRAALIFYSILLVTYTTFFTNFSGIGSGLWQSLGYWVIQQGEARGGQPWYYYLIITSVYEFLPLVFSILGTIYYLKRHDRFGQFLVFWSVTTFFIYTLASEKMPWLLVHVSLPLIVLAGKFLGDLTSHIRWRQLISPESLGLLAGMPALMISLYTIAFSDIGTWKFSSLVLLLITSSLVILLVTTGYKLTKTLGLRHLVLYATIPMFAILALLSLRTGWIASFKNSDTPVEMIVYTQTSQDITSLAKQIGSSSTPNKPMGISVTIDGTNGFHWPWLWYLRHHGNTKYTTYSNESTDAPPDSDVVLVHSQNKTKLASLLQSTHIEGKQIKHRWWFPEGYRDLTTTKLFTSIVGLSHWHTLMDYFLHRTVRTQLGSEDAYIFISKDSEFHFEPSL